MIVPILDEIAENYEGKIKVCKVDADANSNSLLKLLYAGILKAAERWTHPIQNWNLTFLHFCAPTFAFLRDPIFAIFFSVVLHVTFPRNLTHELSCSDLLGGSWTALPTGQREMLTAVAK